MIIFFFIFFNIIYKSLTTPPNCGQTSIRCVGSTYEYTTIQTAITTAQPGDQVMIAGGIYTETFDVSVSGTAGNYIEFIPFDGEVVTVQLPDGTRVDWDGSYWKVFNGVNGGTLIFEYIGVGQHGIDVNMNGNQFGPFTFKSNSTGVFTSIFAKEIDGLIIEGVTFEGISSGSSTVFIKIIPSTSSYTPGSLQNQRRTIIRNNHFKTVQGDVSALDLRKVGYLLIENNYFEASDRRYFIYSEGLKDTIIQNNIIDTSVRFLDKEYSVENIYITNNLFTDNSNSCEGLYRIMIENSYSNGLSNLFFENNIFLKCASTDVFRSSGTLFSNIMINNNLFEDTTKDVRVGTFNEYNTTVVSTGILLSRSGVNPEDFYRLTKKYLNVYYSRYIPQYDFTGATRSSKYPDYGPLKFVETCAGLTNDNNACGFNENPFHGFCEEYNSCKCGDEWDGGDCQTPKCNGEVDPSACGGNHGTCQNNHNCVCTNHWDLPDCITCNSEWGGINCDEPRCYGLLESENACGSSHGNCQNNHFCNCIADWSGDDCKIPKCFGLTEAEGGCTFHGICEDNHLCQCNDHFDGYNCSICKNGWEIATNCTSCIEGFTGKNCIKSSFITVPVTTFNFLLFIVFIIIAVVVVILILMFILFTRKMKRIRELFKKQLTSPVKMIDIEETKEGEIFNTKQLNNTKEKIDEIKHFVVENQIPVVDYNDISLINYLSSGLSGNVFHGSYQGREIAYKSFSLEKLKQVNFQDFKREIEFFQKIEHKYILSLIGVVFKNDHVGICTQFCRFGDLFYFINENPHLTIKERVRILLQISIAMEKIHWKGFIHRDLKPNNILIDNDLNVQIIDFGVSRAASGKRKTSKIGTYTYMAPEVFESSSYSNKVDVYSFAMCSYFVLSGEVPFSNIANKQDICFQVVKGIRPDLSKLEKIKELNNHVIIDLIKKCWGKREEERLEFKTITKTLKRCWLRLKNPVIIYLKEIGQDDIEAEDFLLIDFTFDGLHQLINDKWPQRKIQNIILKKDNRYITIDEDVQRINFDDVVMVRFVDSLGSPHDINIKNTLITTVNKRKKIIPSKERRPIFNKRKKVIPSKERRPIFNKRKKVIPSKERRPIFKRSIKRKKNLQGNIKNQRKRYATSLIELKVNSIPSKADRPKVITNNNNAKSKKKININSIPSKADRPKVINKNNKPRIKYRSKKKI